VSSVAKTPAETPEFLAIAQILRSKRNAAKLMKAYRGQPFDVLVKAAKEFKKDLQAKKAAARVEMPVSEGEAQKQKELLYVLRTMALSGLPHSTYKKKDLIREIRYGPTQFVQMKFTARDFDEGVLLPSGLNARRVFIMLCTLAVENKSPLITLDSAVKFMQRMGWKMSDKGSTMQGYYWKSLRSILEGLQQMTVDMKYHGIFNKRGKAADSYSIIRRYHLPSASEERTRDQGEQTLYGIEEAHEDPDLGPPGVFWVRMDPLFYADLVGDPGAGITGQAFPFTDKYLNNFKTSKAIDIALFLAARCSAADSKSTIDLHKIWDQLGIDPTNYSMFKNTFKTTLEEVKTIWPGCVAQVDSKADTFIVEPVPQGLEMVPRSLADKLLEEFLSVSPSQRAQQFIAKRENED